MAMRLLEQLRRPRAQSRSGAARWRGNGQGWLPRVSSGMDPETLARALGWFSIGLGLAEVAAPQRFARAIGVPERTGMMRAFGLREIAAGIGILSQRRPAGWVWARVAGDVMDLSALGRAMASDNVDRGRAAAATAAVIGVTALDVLCAEQLRRGEERTSPRTLTRRAIHVTKSITINRPPEEVYRYWRNFENLPRFMTHLEEVRATDEKRSHWRARGLAGLRVEWDAEVTEDRPNEKIAWRSLEGADVPNAGVVRFASGPRGRGTEVKLDMRYSPPGGVVGAAIATLFGEEPSQQAQEDLRNFKRVLETGEIIRS